MKDREEPQVYSEGFSTWIKEKPTLGSLGSPVEEFVCYSLMKDLRGF